MRILIIDDSSAMRRILVGALKALGYETVEQAGSGQEALERMSSTPFDVVLTDWIMPEMDGIELIRTVRATEAIKDVPVLMVTTNATRDHIVAALRAGVSGYVVKPFSPETLRLKIEALALRSAATRPPSEVPPAGTAATTAPAEATGTPEAKSAPEAEPVAVPVRA